MAKPSYHRNYPVNIRWGDAKTQMKHAAGEIIEAAMASDHDEMCDELHEAVECIDGVLPRMDRLKPCIVDETYVRHLAKENARGNYVQG